MLTLSMQCNAMRLICLFVLCCHMFVMQQQWQSSRSSCLPQNLPRHSNPLRFVTWSDGAEMIMQAALLVSASLLGKWHLLRKPRHTLLGVHKYHPNAPLPQMQYRGLRLVCFRHVFGSCSRARAQIVDCNHYCSSSTACLQLPLMLIPDLLACARLYSLLPPR